jgi:hypothetical protein
MNNEDKTVNGWNEWSRHVLAELKRHDELLIGIAKDVTEIRLRIERLDTAFNIKSGVWGLLGALIPAIGIILFEVLKRKP